MPSAATPRGVTIEPDDPELRLEGARTTTRAWSTTTRPRTGRSRQNTIPSNAGAGVIIGDNVISDNCLPQQRPVRIQRVPRRTASRHRRADHNEIAGNNTDDWESRATGMRLHRRRQVLGHQRRTSPTTTSTTTRASGCGPTPTTAASFRGQLHLQQRRRRHLVRDQLQRGDPHNTFVAQRPRQGPDQPRLPDSGDLISESGDSRGRTTYSRTFEIPATCSSTTGRASSSGRTPTGSRFAGQHEHRLPTLVNPKSPPSRRATRRRSHEPYFDDCRWKTQNVLVHRNTSASTRSQIAPVPAKAAASTGLFSNYGTYPLVALQGQGRTGERHVQAEQRLAQQHLLRSLALHGVR